mgnify:CR=1 FL=1
MDIQKYIDLIDRTNPNLSNNEKLVLMPSNRRENHYSISIRKHDLSGTDYTPIMTITEKEAIEINEKSDGIFFLFGIPKNKS